MRQRWKRMPTNLPFRQITRGLTLRPFRQHS